MSEFKAPMELMAFQCGISKDTLERMYKTTYAVRAAIDRGRLLGKLKVQVALFNGAMTKGPRQERFIILWLKQIAGWVPEGTKQKTPKPERYLKPAEECDDYDDYVEDPEFQNELNEVVKGMNYPDSEDMEAISQVSIKNSTASLDLGESITPFLIELEKFEIELPKVEFCELRKPQMLESNFNIELPEFSLDLETSALVLDQGEGHF